MKKIQKIEFITIFLFLIFFILFIQEVLKGCSLFGGECNISNVGMLSFWFLLLFLLTFLVIYIIKILNEKDKLVKLLWIVFPVVSILFSILYVDGVFGFDFFFFNLIGIILEFVMIVFYNLFFLYYFDDNRKMIITLILYNFVVLLNSVDGSGIDYIHHYYLGYLILAIWFGYIELIIRNKLEKKN